MDGWKDGMGQGSGGFLQQMKAVSFSNGVILSLIHHLLVETILFLAYPPPFVLVINGQHMTSFFGKHKRTKLSLSVLEMLTVKTHCVITPALFPGD